MVECQCARDSAIMSFVALFSASPQSQTLAGESVLSQKVHGKCGSVGSV